MTASPATNSPSRGRIIGARVLLVLGVLLTVVSILSTYVKREALDEGQFKQTSQELIASPAIQEQVAATMVEALYANVDVSGELTNKLPDNLQGLAAPIAGISRELVDRGAQELIQRPRAQQAFVEISSISQQQLSRSSVATHVHSRPRTATSSSTCGRSCSGSETASASSRTWPTRCRRTRRRSRSSSRTT